MNRSGRTCMIDASIQTEDSSLYWRWHQPRRSTAKFPLNEFPSDDGMAELL